MIPQYEPEFSEAEAKAVYDYMLSGGWLTEHKYTEIFEAAIAGAVCSPYASAVNNGTVSLSIALLALGLGPGDKVVIPDLTMIATATAVMMIGCEPVLCDVDPVNLCLDLNQAIVLAYREKAKAVIYVSLNGRSHTAGRLEAFRDALRSCNINLIEDAAQSFGAKTPDGVPLGSIGDIGSFSFSPHKIISTGQGGALVTNSSRIHEWIERLKDFGRLSGGADVHDHFGINAKFTDLQAVVGIEQIKKLQARKEAKLGIYVQYEHALSDIGPMLEMIPHYSIPWFVDVFVSPSKRGKLRQHLLANGVGSREFYPPLHTQKIFGRKYRGEFPVAEAWSRGGLWLPSSFNLSSDDIRRICDVIAGSDW